jgi:membrane protein DedA with SNARE-associated domain
MTLHIYHLVDTYGYWLIALGAFFEGDTFLIAGGVAAEKHLLNALYLIVIAIFLSMLHDGILFYLGRFTGAKLIKKYPKIEKKMEKPFSYIDKYGVWVILILRFAYGFRTLIPIAIGMGKISGKKFFIYDFLGGVLWSLTFILGGALFGKAMALVIREFEWFGDFENLTIVLVLLIFLFMLCGAIYHWIRRIKIKKRLHQLASKISDIAHFEEGSKPSSEDRSE